MYKLLKLIGLALILSSCGNGIKEDNSTPHALGELIFNSIKHNRKDIYVSYIYSADDINDFKAQFTGSAEKKLQFEKRESNRLVEYSEMLKNSIDAIRSNAEEEGIIDWDGFEFQRVTFTKKDRDGTNVAENTIIEFKSDQFLGHIRLRTIMESSRGWVLAGVPVLGRIHNISLLNK